MKVLFLCTSALSYNTLAIQKHIFLQTSRKLSLTSSEMNKYLGREAKMLGKLIGTSKKRKKLYFDETPNVKDGRLSFGKPAFNSKENIRRIAVLNSLFMKHISDMLINSSIAEGIWGKGLEISKVAMAPDFNQVNVFWATSKEDNSGDLEAALPHLGFSLRHELSQLRVMGIVPRIVFVKDKHYSSALKVDYLLSIADFGEDHVPLQQESEFKSNAVVDPRSITAIQNRLETKNTDNNGESTLDDEVMPVMRQDVFSLDHDRIMTKIMKSLKKSRAVHRFQPNLVVESEGTDKIMVHTPIAQMTVEERKSTLAKFILSRKILLQKNKDDKFDSHLKIETLKLDENDDDYSAEDFHVEDYLEEDQDGR